MAVIFEVTPAVGRRQDYLDAAVQLRAYLSEIDGFVSIERFQSLSDPDKLLSLSFWRDEAAVQAWRNREAHRDTQRAGRDGMLAGYRLRVALVMRDYGLDDRAQAPEDSRTVHG